MALNYLECDDYDALLTYMCDPCELVELGGVRSLCLVKKGVTVAVPLNLSAFTAQVESGDIIILPSTRGTFDGGTPKMVTGFGNQKERLSGHDYVLAVKAPNYAANAPFMAAIEKVEEWNLAFVTETQFHLCNSSATITTKAPVEEALDSEVTWNIEAKWFSRNKPVLTPASVIATLLKCFEIE